VLGSTGLISQQAEKLLSNNSFTYTVAGGISIPLWDWRNTRYQSRAAQEELKARQALLRQQIASAGGALQTAQANAERTRRQVAAVDKTLATAQRTVRLSTELFTRGLTTFLDVLTAQQNLISLQSRRAALQGQYLQALADYYVARGGR
jgi:outer membrane protein TolC